MRERERSKHQENQVMHNTISHYPLTPSQAIPRQQLALPSLGKRLCLLLQRTLCEDVESRALAMGTVGRDGAESTHLLSLMPVSHSTCQTFEDGCKT